MTRGIVLLLLLLTLGVVGSFCVVILDEREQAFRTLLNDPDPKLFGLSLNRAILTEPGWYIRIPGLHQLHRNPISLHSRPKSHLHFNHPGHCSHNHRTSLHRHSPTYQYLVSDLRGPRRRLPCRWAGSRCLR